MIFLVALVAFLTDAAMASSVTMPSWPNRTVLWWYACDNDWPAAVAQITPYAPTLVTSIQTYCGWDVSDAGKIIGSTSPQCVGFFAAIGKMGVRAELATGAGNCSIASYRLLWADTTTSPQQLLAAALAVNASGWNIDFEPQADNCQGSPTGTPADAVLFASWLTSVRSALHPHGVRLTVDVASWSPVLGQFAVLAKSVDRLQNMGTYNGGSSSEWMSGYTPYLAATPLAAVGVGIGAWSDGGTAWWETPEGAAFKVARARADKVPELAVFRIVPGATPWPLDFWWAALAKYVAP